MFRTIIILFLIFVPLKAQEYSGKIIPLTKPSTKNIINGGPVFIDDSIRFSFEIINDGAKALFMQPLVPSFYLGVSPNDPTQSQFTFFRRITSLERIFPPGTRDTLIIQFNPGDIIAPPLGWYEALLGMSLLKNDDRTAPPIAKIDTFLLRAKKIATFLNGMNDVINFDSVYVNPNVEQTMKWELKNAWTESIKLESYKLVEISQQPSGQEIFIQQRPPGIKIQPKNLIEWKFNYHPLDRGSDTIEYQIFYKPYPSNFPDSLNFASVKVVGTGVEQKMQLMSSNYNIVGDTLDLGNVRVGESITIIGVFKNLGNIPFRALKQSVIDIFTRTSHKDFNVLIGLGNKQNDILPDSSDGFAIRFQPNEPGLELAEYIIESNLMVRGIKGAQNSDAFVRLHIKSNVVSPKLLILKDTLDFGAVTLNKPACLNYKDTTLTIYNTGNENLIIKNISIFNGYVANFFTNTSVLEIPPNSQGRIDIRFENNSGQIGEYEARLRLVTNSPKPMDTVFIVLRTVSTPPLSAYLSIPENLRASPGRMIEVPVLISSDILAPPEYAKSVNFGISYDRSILEYKGIVTLGTATAGASFEGDNREFPEKQSVNIKLTKLGGDFFERNDTLCKIRFYTYLGHSVATEIAFINPKFSDGNCDDLFDLTITNGMFVTDSVCGLELKAVPTDFRGFGISYLYTEPIADRVVFECTISRATDVTFTVYDAYGRIVNTESAGNIPAGTYQYFYNTGLINSGTYFIEMRAPFLTTYESFTVIK